ncbi:1-alkyl-2-acetylglycerophosphocholine esterase [Babesia caballi]|uniref:1-alkyl-2-acetylglycerophosphocholine esterase n=1 Tax=Babesia caballi TaxID=5871 RepID=A0AAV4LLJ0_BABCB|nr:1-alkyl-2-acetylglycerophosphocholine esterase [Babesia caballi]
MWARGSASTPKPEATHPPDTPVMTRNHLGRVHAHVSAVAVLLNEAEVGRGSVGVARVVYEARTVAVKRRVDDVVEVQPEHVNAAAEQTVVDSLAKVSHVVGNDDASVLHNQVALVDGVGSEEAVAVNARLANDHALALCEEGQLLRKAKHVLLVGDNVGEHGGPVVAALEAEEGVAQALHVDVLGEEPVLVVVVAVAGGEEALGALLVQQAEQIHQKVHVVLVLADAGVDKEKLLGDLVGSAGELELHEVLGGEHLAVHGALLLAFVGRQSAVVEHPVAAAAELQAEIESPRGENRVVEVGDGGAAEGNVLVENGGTHGVLGAAEAEALVAFADLPVGGALRREDVSDGRDDDRVKGRQHVVDGGLMVNRLAGSGAMRGDHRFAELSGLGCHMHERDNDAADQGVGTVEAHRPSHETKEALPHVLGRSHVGGDVGVAAGFQEAVGGNERRVTSGKIDRRVDSGCGSLVDGMDVHLVDLRHQVVVTAVEARVLPNGTPQNREKAQRAPGIDGLVADHGAPLAKGVGQMVDALVDHPLSDGREVESVVHLSARNEAHFKVRYQAAQHRGAAAERGRGERLLNGGHLGNHRIVRTGELLLAAVGSAGVRRRAVRSRFRGGRIGVQRLAEPGLEGGGRQRVARTRGPREEERPPVLHHDRGMPKRGGLGVHLRVPLDVVLDAAQVLGEGVLGRRAVVALAARAARGGVAALDVARGGLLGARAGHHCPGGVPLGHPAPHTGLVRNHVAAFEPRVPRQVRRLLEGVLHAHTGVFHRAPAGEGLGCKVQAAGNGLHGLRHMEAGSRFGYVQRRVAAA